MSRSRARWTNTRYGPSGSPAPPPVAAVPALSSTAPAVTVVTAGVNVVQDVEVTSTAGSISAFGIGTITHSSGSGWCTAQHRVDATTGKRYVRYTINPSTLTAGSYTATIPVTFGNASPSSIDCVVAVTAVASLNGILRAGARNVNAGTVAAGTSPSPTTILLRNIGSNLQLAGPVVGSVVYYSGSGWMSVSTTNNGNGTFTLTLTPNTSALGGGNYRCSFAVSDAACTNSIEVHYDVAVTAAAVPSLTASPAALLFTAVEGGSDPAPQTIILSNAGGGTLAGPTVSESPAAAWVTPAIAGSGNTYTCTVAPVTGSLTPSAYATTLEFADANDTTSAAASRRVNVTFTVQATSLPPRTQTGTLERLDTGTGSVRGACGVQLPPGWLLPGNTAQFRILDASSNEIPIYVEAQTGLHSDGSLQAVYVEFQQVLSTGTPVPITMQCGVSRNTAQDLTRQVPNDAWILGGPVSDRASTTINWKQQHPAAMINFPASYLSTTRWWGDFDLRYKGEPGGPSFQNTYFTRWEAGHTNWWNIWNGFADVVQQYDQPMATAILWCCTGNSEYYKRSCTHLVEERNRYIRLNSVGNPGAGVAPQEMMPWGLAAHYRLTGDTSSRSDLGNMALAQSNPAGIPKTVNAYVTEPRPLAFITQMLLAAKRVGATNGGTNWDARMDAFLAKWLPVSYGHPMWITSSDPLDQDGTSDEGGCWNNIMYQGGGMPSNNTYPVTQNFYNALMTRALVQYLHMGSGTYNTDATTRITGMLNWLYTYQRSINTGGAHVHHYNNNSQAFVINNSLFGQAGHSIANTVDLSGLFAGAFGTAGVLLNNATWITHSINLQTAITLPLTGGQGGPWINNSQRVFGEWFNSSWEALARIWP